MKVHYFEQEKADADDWKLAMAIGQGYVPSTCLLGGAVAMAEVSAGKDPCNGCNCPRDRCRGRKNQEKK
jgi:hypothetical protein